MGAPDNQIAPDDIAVGLAQLSDEGKLMAANSASCALLGASLPEVANLPFDQLFVSDEFAAGDRTAGASC